MTNTQKQSPYVIPEPYKSVYFGAAEIRRLVELIQNCALAAGYGDERGVEALDVNVKKLVAEVAEMQADMRKVQ